MGLSDGEQVSPVAQVLVSSVPRTLSPRRSAYDPTNVVVVTDPASAGAPYGGDLAPDRDAPDRDAPDRDGPEQWRVVADEMAATVAAGRDSVSSGVLGTAVGLARIGAGVAAGVAGSLVKRATSGPLVTGWTVADQVMQAAVGSMMGVVSTSLDPATVNGVERVIDVATRVMWPPPGYRNSLTVVTETTFPVHGDWIRPQGYTMRGVVLYLHGGGYLGGSPWTHRAATSKLAMRTSTGVFVPEYRLAPEHPFPAALDDALACYAELLARGIPPRYIVVAGDSAGGGLAAALGVALVQRGLPQPAGYALLSPEVDLTLGGVSITDNAATDILPPDIPTVGYVGDADPTDPLVSPLFADADVLAQLAPMLIQIGGREMLRDGQRAFAAKVAAAGIPVWLHEEPDMFHVWPILLTRRVESKQVGFRVGAFIEQLLGPLPLVAEPGLITPGLDETDQQRATAVRSAGQLHTDDAVRRELFGYDLW